MLPRRPYARVGILAVALVIAAAGAVAAQTADDLFDDSVLHDVRLHVHSDDWARLKADFSENTYYPADLEWRGLKVRNVGIRSRGLGTRNEFKPGLRVDMNRYASGQRFLGMRAVLLDNVYRDISGIRERVAMKLFARFGLPVPREAHARLSVNGEYVGVYVITEELGEDFVRRVFKKPESGEPDRGMLFEYKWIDDWNFRYLGPDLEIYKRRFEARTHENDATSDLYAPIEELVRDVNEMPEDRFVEEVDALLDLRQLMTYLAVEALLVDYDGLVGYKGMANFYLYRPEGSRRAILIPWDKDQTFFVANRDVAHGIGGNELLRRVRAHPELDAVFLDTLEAAARFSAAPPEGGSLPWMEAEVVRARDQIHTAVIEDPNRWFGRSDFEEELDRMLEFARTRPAFVLCQVEQMRRLETAPPTCAAPARQPSR